MSFIYGLHAPDDPEIRYVGLTTKAVEKRRKEHIKTAARGDGTWRSRWIRTLLENDLEPESIILETDPVGGCAEAEKAWIATLRRYGCRLTNGTVGGDGSTGHVVSEEARERLRLANLGKTHTPESRAKISAANKGRPVSEESIAKRRATREKNGTLGVNGWEGKHLSEEHRAKISASNTGKTHTPETREKLSVAATGRLHTDEAKAKMSAAQKGKVTSLETRAKMSAAATGKKFTEEHRAAISASKSGENHPNWGKQRSPETRARIGAAQKGRPGKIPSDETRAKMSESAKARVARDGHVVADKSLHQTEGTDEAGT